MRARAQGGGAENAPNSLTKDDPLCTPVVAAGERPEALLACCVPAVTTQQYTRCTSRSHSNTHGLGTAWGRGFLRLLACEQLGHAAGSPHCEFDALAVDS
jgi:hypothetical protein